MSLFGIVFGKRRKTTVGYRYYMGLHFGVCQGPVDALLRILVGDRVAWQGMQTQSGAVQVNAPQLFGGDDGEGGVQGTLDVMMGGDDQPANSYLASAQGPQQPSYRGLLSAVLRRGLVSSNSPYLKPWSFTVRRILAGWHGGAAWYPETAEVQMIGGPQGSLDWFAPTPDSWLVTTTSDGLPRYQLGRGESVSSRFEALQIRPAEPYTDLRYIEFDLLGPAPRGFFIGAIDRSRWEADGPGRYPQNPTSAVTFDGDLSSFAGFSVITGSISEFSVVSTPYGPGFRMAPHSGIGGVNIGRPINTSSFRGFTVKFRVAAGGSSNLGGAMSFGNEQATPTNFLVFRPRGNGSGMFPTSSPTLQFPGSQTIFNWNIGNPVDPGVWHELDFTYSPSTGALSTTIRRQTDFSVTGTQSGLTNPVTLWQSPSPRLFFSSYNSGFEAAETVYADLQIKMTPGTEPGSGFYGLTNANYGGASIGPIIDGVMQGGGPDFTAPCTLGLMIDYFNRTLAVYVDGVERWTYTLPHAEFDPMISIARQGSTIYPLVQRRTRWRYPIVGARSFSDIGAAAVVGMNPAHIVYQCLTDPEWGMGYSPTIISDAKFRQAADVFHAEGMGLCLHWTQQQPIERFIQTVMDHVGAVLRQDPRTGLFEIKPMRGGYDVGTLPVFDESNIRSLDAFDRAGLPDAVNEVTVRYDDAGTGKTSSVTVHNMAVVTAVGAVVAQSRSYPGLPTTSLAQRVAMRDLLVLSTPLARARFSANRKGYAVLPGDVIRMAWPKLGIASIVLRVARMTQGSLTDGTVEIEGVEDVFGLGASSYVAQQPVGWVAPDAQPAPAALRRAVEAPYYELQRSLSDADLAVLSASSGYLIAAAARPAFGALRFEIVTRAGSSGDFTSGGEGDFCAAGILASSLSYTGTTVGLTSVSDAGLIGAGSYALIDDEIVRVDGYDAAAGTLTIGRGVLDTVAQPHSAGAAVYFLDEINTSDGVERVDGDVVQVKLLTRTGQGLLAQASAPTDSVTFDSRAARPYPPGRLRINGQAYPASAGAPLVISWAHRNRLQQALEGDETGNIGPEPGTTYSVELRDADTGVLIVNQTGITGDSFTPGAIIGAFRLRAIVSAARGGLQSMQRHDVTVDFAATSAPTTPIAAIIGGKTLAAAAGVAPTLSAVACSLVDVQAAAAASASGSAYYAYFEAQNTITGSAEPVPPDTAFFLDIQRPAGSSVGIVSYTTPAWQSRAEVYAGMAAAFAAHPTLPGLGYSVGSTVLLGQPAGFVSGPPSTGGIQVLSSATPGPTFALSVTSPGSDPVPADRPQITMAAFSGTPATGDRVTLTLGGAPFTVTAKPGQPLLQVVAELAALIDAAAAYAVRQDGADLYISGPPNVPYTRAFSATAAAAYASGQPANGFAPARTLAAGASLLAGTATAT